eukprot:15469965-Alexandrium_andersonii.AAC.1
MIPSGEQMRAAHLGEAVAQQPPVDETALSRDGNQQTPGTEVLPCLALRRRALRGASGAQIHK